MKDTYVPPTESFVPTNYTLYYVIIINYFDISLVNHNRYFVEFKQVWTSEILNKQWHNSNFCALLSI